MSNEKKYELTDETRVVDGVTLRRIRALRRVRPLISPGTLGGWVESERNLAHEGECWIYPNATAMGNARVVSDARVTGEAVVKENALVTRNAMVFSSAVVGGYASVTDEGEVFGNATLTDNSSVGGFGRVSGKAVLSENAVVSGYGYVDGDARLSGGAYVAMGHVGDDATVRGSLDVITLAGVFEDVVTVYRADKVKAGHRVVAGCQVFDLESAEKIEELASCHGWTLPSGWKALRLSLRATVRAWRKEAGAQGE